MKKAFTLVELLFVMAIISILTGFAVKNGIEQRELAQISTMKTDIEVNAKQNQTFCNKYEYCDFLSLTNYNQTDFGGIAGNYGTRFSVSPHNSIQITDNDCGSGMPGFQITLTSEYALNTKFIYDSCSGSTEEVVLP